MTAIDYTTVSVSGQAVEFTGSNADEIQEFAGEDFIEAVGDRVWVREAEGPVEVHRGWLVAREEGVLFVYSPAGFRSHKPQVLVS